MAKIKIYCNNISIYHLPDVKSITNNIIEPNLGVEAIRFKTRNLDITETLTPSNHGDQVQQSLEFSYLVSTLAVKKLRNDMPVLLQIHLNDGTNKTFGTISIPAIITQVQSKINGGKISIERTALGFEFVQEFNNQFNPNIVALPGDGGGAVPD